MGLKARGLEIEPKLAIGDGALGFWKALAQVYGNTRQQRCWVHKTGNVLNYLPKSVQPKAKQALHEIWMAETREEAERLVPRNLPGEVPQGSRLPGQGPHGVTGLLRLPGRALGAPADHEPDRVDLRHRQAAHGQDPRLPVAPDHAHHGLQALPERPAEMATFTGLPTPCRRRPRCPVHRRNQ